MQGILSVDCLVIVGRPGEYCTLETLNSFSLDFCDEIGIDKLRTFAVRVKRVGVHDITSQQKAAELGYLILNNLLVLDDACSLPVYRPLMGFDKVEIERIAREIGTFVASILSTSSCSAVPKKPVTKAKLEKVLDVEREVTYDAEF